MKKNARPYRAPAPLLRPLSSLALFAPLFALAQVAPKTEADEAATKEKETVTLSAFQVSAMGDRGYGVTNSMGASRIALPVEDIATSVATLNRTFQDDVGAIDLVESIKYVSGVDMAAPMAEQWSQRGTGTNVSMMDGIPDPSVGGGNRERYDPLLTERIEVIKGPVGTLYGAHAAGGLVNRVTKFPLPVARNELAATVGSWGQTRLDYDSTGPLSQVNGLAYRFVGSIRDGEYDYKNSVYDSQLFSPMFTYALNARSKFWARFVYRTETRPTEGTQNWFLDAGNHVSYFIPRDRPLDNYDSRFRTIFHGYDTGFDTSFETGRVEWATRAVFRFNSAGGDSTQYTKPTYTFLDANGVAIGTQANTLFTDPRLANISYVRNRRERGDDREAYVYDWDISAKADVGPTKQWGFTYIQGGRDDSSNFNRVYPYAPSNVNNPVYFANGRDGITGAPTSVTAASTLVKWYAWGIHDNMFMWDKRIVLSAGARYDHFDTTGTNLISRAVTKSLNKQWSHKYGGIVKPVKGVSLFYNYSQTFAPENRIDPIGGTKFPNQVATTNEYGVKVEILDNRITGTLSSFDTEQNNVVLNVHDPVTGNINLKAVGKQTVKGWEGDFNLQPIDSITMKVGVGSIDEAHNELGLRPRWVGIGLNYKFFGKYTFRRGLLRGFGFGGGVVYTNDSAGDATDTFTLPGYAVWDGLLQYAPGNRWSVQLNVYNVTDKVYAVTAVDRTLIYSAPPRNFRATFRYKF